MSAPRAPAAPPGLRPPRTRGELQPGTCSTTAQAQRGGVGHGLVRGAARGGLFPAPHGPDMRGGGRRVLLGMGEGAAGAEAAPARPHQVLEAPRLFYRRLRLHHCLRLHSLPFPVPCRHFGSSPLDAAQSTLGVVVSFGVVTGFVVRRTEPIGAGGAGLEGPRAAAHTCRSGRFRRRCGR